MSIPEPDRVIVMGAGPAGLTAAYELTKHSVSTIVFEKDPVYVGGIARTVEYKGYRFDIGGHRFFSKNQEVEELWTEILGEEMLSRGRLSRIYYRGRYFDYPIKAGNALRGLGPVEAVRCALSYAWAKLLPVKTPRTLEDWVRNQFGFRLYSIFFKTYTEKVWGISTRQLSADWAAQRIKGLDLGEVIKRALLPRRKPRAGDAVIKTLIDRFRYPRMGPGQLWERVRDILLERGQEVHLGHQVVAVNHEGGRVRSVTVLDPQGEWREVEGAQFISSAPIRDLVLSLCPAAPERVREAASALSYRDFLTVALIIDRPELFPDNWIYIHEPGVQVGRMQNFKNWSPDMVPDPDRTCLGLEYFCFEGDDLWSRSDEGLIQLATEEVARLGMVDPEHVVDGVVVRQAKAYPVYDDEYEKHVAVIRSWLERSLPNLHLVGRNGMHKYNNQDHSMLTSLLVARNIATGTAYDPWKVNGDAEYHEEVREGDEDRTGRLVPRRVDATS
jgi:protoporphyrinogen oxidase